jgi:hypothetical protein
MPTTKETNSLVKDMKDVAAGLLVATASTVMLRLLGRRGRIARTVSAATALLRHRFVHERTTTQYSLTREVSHNEGSRDE